MDRRCASSFRIVNRTPKMIATMSKASTPMAQPGLGSLPQARNPRIVSWGELLWDLFPDRSLLGGSAANVAYHAAHLGAESWLVSAVGDDPLGKRATAILGHAGVITDGIGLERGAPTGRVRVTMDGGQPNFSIDEGVAWDNIDPSPQILENVLEADVLCFSTLAQRTPLSRTRLRSVLRKVHAKGRCHAFGGAQGRRPIRILDLNLRPPFTEPATVLEALSYADVVKVNEAEATWLGALAQTSDPVRWLLSQFPARLVAVTRAEKGASFFTRHLTLHQPGTPQRGGDPVGAGDAFVAALAVGLGLAETLPRCLEMATALGSWVAGRIGAMPAHPRGRV